MAEKRKLAFYIRLSDADEEVKAGTKDESNSITGQRKLLYAYIKKTEEFAGFEVLEYFDDGYSGTMFNNRAEFQRLIQDAELGRFECIIVKDFSRFGRDYLEVGNYLEFVFPAMGMRFISVNDNYDSDRNFGVKAEYDRISNSTVSCYQSYREGKYTKEEYVQLRKTNQELLADLENQISDLQEKVANQEPDAEEKIEQLTQYSMLEQYDGDVLSNIIDKVLIYNDKDIEVVFKGENFIRNAV